MCGIAGIWNFKDRLDLPQVKTFTDSMTHRGPDGGGYVLLDNDHLGLGHRRLSILDLSDNGKQPMSFGDARYTITYNGEIFNFTELKSELISFGYSFHTGTDTEVILAAYHKWSEQCLHKFNGMWAFAIWDQAKQELFLSRDRYGIKPLHYTFSPGSLFAFASETIAFNCLSGFDKTLDAANFQGNSLYYNYTEANNRTLYKDLFQIPAGTYVIVNRSAKELRFNKWFDQREAFCTVGRSYEQQVEEFRELFFDSLKIRLRSDVNIASALSGGLDSSSVFCSLGRVAEMGIDSGPLPADWKSAYVNTFPDTDRDESGYARIVEKHTAGRVVYIDPDRTNLAAELVRSTKLFDSISGTAINCVSDVYRAMKRDRITVSLDGHGVDELLFGYTGSVKAAYIDSVVHDTGNPDELLAIYASMFEPTQRQQKLNALRTAASRLAQTKKVIDSRSFLRKKLSDMKRQFAGEDLLTVSDAWYPGQIFRIADPDAVDLRNSGTERRNFNDFFLTDIPYNLRDFDRGSMQFGVEIRMPFMDHRLVSYCFSLPLSAKLGGGYTKRILRDAMTGILPEQIRTRTFKQGLSAPLSSWFNNELNGFVADEVRSAAFLTSNLWDGPLISEFAGVRCAAKTWNEDDAQRFWVVLNAHILINK